MNKYDVGTRHGGYTVIARFDAKRRAVRCDCGAERVAFVGNLKNNTHGCAACGLGVGRISPRRVDRTGQIFGKWTVLRDTEHGCSRRVLARCECGAEETPFVGNLVYGYSKGCLRCSWTENGLRRRDENAPSKHPLFSTWTGMVRRCHDEHDGGFPNYGARGISVCAEWRESFESFAAYMGAKPSDDHSIDRIDNDGNYEPGNVRWATQAQQARNTRRCRWMTVNGERLLMVDAARRLGITRQAVHQRLSNGWTDEEAVTVPRGQTPTRLSASVIRTGARGRPAHRKAA